MASSVLCRRVVRSSGDLLPHHHARQVPAALLTQLRPFGTNAAAEQPKQSPAQPKLVVAEPERTQFKDGTRRLRLQYIKQLQQEQEQREQKERLERERVEKEKVHCSAPACRVE